MNLIAIMTYISTNSGQLQRSRLLGSRTGHFPGPLALTLTLESADRGLYIPVY
jgi:hypothetical protein